MKGTFISADFVENSNGDLKFLELNTDTAATPSLLEQDIWSGLFELISGSTLTGTPITEFHVVYKPAVHDNIIDNLSQSLAESASFITTFTLHSEELETIYPSNVQDADDRFILRLAYDENAILDSTYCKDGKESLLLFNENNDLDSCVPYYYSSSAVSVNSLVNTLNTDTPDFVIKSNNTLESVQFYAAGPHLSGSTYVSSSEFTNQRIANFTSSIFENKGNADNSYLMNYIQPSETSTDGAVSSIRSYHIVYGASLNTLNLGVVRQYAPLTLPTGSQINWNDSISSSVEIGYEHYHEFSTSNLKEGVFKRPGAFETENVISSSGEALDVEFIHQNWSTSSVIELKTFFISGSPDTDFPSDYLKWSYIGNTLPSGSFISQSLVTGVQKMEVERFSLSALQIEGSNETHYISPVSNLLVYESSSNETKFIPVKSINTTDTAGYFSYNPEGELKRIIKNEFLVMNSGETGSFYSIDVEANDYYFVGDLGSVAIAMHNCCFVAGTEVSLENGDVKNIEDVVIGDAVVSYNHEKSEKEIKQVIDIKTPIQTDIVTYKLSNGKEITSTHDHPYYLSDNSISSYSPEKTNHLNSIGSYNIEGVVNQIKVGDKLVDIDGNHIEILEIIESDKVSTQTYTLSIEDNHNFYANEILVHNKDPK